MKAPGDSAGLVTELDHENGFKDVICETRAGATRTVKVTAVSHRDAPGLLERVTAGGDPWLVLYESISELDKNCLDKLSPFSASQLMGVAWALAYGTEFQKKMEAMGLARLGIASVQTSDVPRSSSSAADSTPATCADGASPS
jgi:hypothetical protein